MYAPPHFAAERSEALVLAARHGFGTLVTPDEGTLHVSHLPMLLSETADGPVLRGHVARANPHWRAFDGERESLAVFAGPHAYVSPAWYADPAAPPTWNYAVAHLHGPARVLDAEGAEAVVADLVDKHESEVGSPWSRELPEPLRRSLMRAIVAFELPVVRVEGKFKFSQNRPEGDPERVAAALQESPDAGSRALGELMARRRPRTGGR